MPVARFNVAIAIRYTPYYAQSTGWAPDITKVCRALGFATRYPTPREFVAAVSEWQRKHPPLWIDGMLGPLTWKKLGQAVAALQGAIQLVGPQPDWITPKADSRKAPPPPPAKASPTAVNKEDKVIEEMAKVAFQTKQNPYLAVPVSGAYAADQGYPRGVKSDPTGLPISQTLEVGQQWQGIAGTRIILGLSGGGTFGSVLFVTDSGQLYSQRVTGWESDMFAKNWSDVSKSMRPIKLLLDAQAAFLLGMCAATSVAAAAFVFVGSVTQWMAKNKDEMPKYIYTVEQILDIRAKMKVIAPTLWSKVVDIAINRLFAEIPSSMSKDPIVIARFAGGVLVKLGRAVWTRNLASLGPWIGALGEIIFAALRSVPGAVKQAVSAEDIVEKLKAIGAEVSIQDAMAIKGEVEKNGPELKKMFSTIESLASLFK